MRLPPSPAGKYYLDQLGGDINVSNILPNLFYGIGGNTFITYPNERHWPLENKERIEEFFKPLGGVMDIKPEHVRHMLAAMVTVEIIKLGLFAMAAALEESGKRVNHQDLAAYLRAYHQQKHKYFPRNTAEMPGEALDSDTLKGIARLYDAWIAALHDYLLEPEWGRKWQGKF